ncbi:MAG: carboxypeptidase-like regulatory domain-containing protein, partial [Ilumatobacteraceae bacterium]
MRLDLAQQSIDLAPGQPAGVDVRVENTADEPFDVVIGVAGLDAAGGARPVARLGVIVPGGVVTTTLQFALPIETAAGLRDIAIHVEGRRPHQPRGVPADIGMVRQSANLRLRVGSTAQLSLRLARTEVHGRFRGRIRADLQNQGVEPVTLRLWGEGEGVTVSFDRPELTLAPGHGARVKGKVHKPGFTWRRENRRAFVVTAQGASTPATTAGSYLQRGVLPRSIVRLVAIVLILGLWIGGLIWVNHEVRKGASTHGRIALTGEPGAVIPGSPGSASGAGGTAAGGAGGTAGTGGTAGGSGAGAGGAGGAGGASAGGANSPTGTKVAVSMLGAVDGPSDKVGTQAILEVISLGTTTANTAQPGKVAAFASVRHAIAPLSPTQRTSTDDTGKFRFDDIVDTPGLFRLTVFRQGFDVASQVVNIDGSKPNVELAIKLAPAAGALAGKVVDGSGTPLGGATISVTASGTTIGAEQGDLHYETTSADGTGAWRLDGVATPATYVVRITKDSYASASLIATLDGGDTNLGLDAKLNQGVGTVHALVRSGDTGIGALTVKLTSTTSSFSTTTRTEDPVGFFEIPGAPLGTYTLDISGDGWQTSDREVIVDRGDVDLGIISDLRSSTAKISGVVRQQVVSTNNSDGTTSTCVFPKSSTDPAIVLQPCGGVGIVASNGDKTYRTTSASGDGSFLLAGVPPGTYSMSFERAGYQTVLFTTTVAGGDVVDLPSTDLILIPTNSNANGSVRLFVASAANLVLTGITVQVVGQQATPQSVASTGSPDAIPVQIVGLLPGTYNIRVTADEHDAGFVQVQIPLGATVNAGTVSLTPLASVGGQVSGFQSRPVPGAVVFITPDTTDPNASTLLVAPRGAPANPDTAYLSADPAVGEVRLCARNVAAVGAPPDVRRGVCTRTNDLGRYDFTRLMRTGKYLAFAPENLVDDASSEIALDHTVRSFQVSTTVGQQANLDLPLVRFGAIVGTVRTPDPATGTDFLTVDGIEVTATLCQSSSGPTGCAIPPTGAVYQRPRGRPSTGDNGTYRIDRLTPPGFDVTSNVTVTSYLVRFHKDGFVDVYLSVTAPNLNEERKLDAIMLPKPTRVALTPYWFKAGSTTPVPIPNATVTIAGIVDYTTEPLAPVSGSSTGPLNASGVFDTNAVPCAPARPNVPVCTFKSGSVNITVTAPGFPTTNATVSVDPTSTVATTLQNVLFAPDPSTPDQTLLSARLFIDPLPQAISGTLTPRCCTTPVNGVATPPALSTSAATAVLASVRARLTVPGNAAVTLTAPVDLGGNYNFGVVPPGTWSLTFEVFGPDPNLIGNHIAMPAATAIELVPAVSQRLGQKIALLQKATVFGTITDADNGRPLVGAAVTIANVTAANGIGALTTTTNGAGAFTLDVWDIPRSLAVTVSTNDGRPSTVTAERLYTPGASIRFDPALPGPRATLTGTVAGQENPGVGAVALQGVTIELRVPGGTTAVLRPDGTPMSATSAADGTFTLPEIVASNIGVQYDLVYTFAGYDTIRNPLRVVTGPTNLPPAVMAATARTVAITVLSNSPAPDGSAVGLGNVVVTATLNGNPAQVRVTTQSGTFGQATFLLRPGTWTFTTTNASNSSTIFGSARHQDTSLQIDVPVGTGTFTPPAISLRGPLVPVNGNVSGRANQSSALVLVPGATVTLTAPDGTISTATTDANGNWSLQLEVLFDLSTRFTVTASAPGYATSAPIPVLVPLGGTSVPPIVLVAAPVNVPVQIVGAETGSPALAGVRVTATLRGSTTVVNGIAPSDASGNVTLVLAPGLWDLVTSGGPTATPAPHGDVTGVVTVAVGSVPALTTLRMSVLARVSGVVRSQPLGDVQGIPTAPLGGVSISLTFAGVGTSPAVTVYSTVSNPDGTYQLFVPANTYQLSATSPGYNSYTGPSLLVVPDTGAPNTNFTMSQQPLTIQGTVFTPGTGVVGVPGVKVTFSSVVGSATYTTTVNTLPDGSYQIHVPASMTWTVAFDPSTAGAVGQNVPVLYRYVGPGAGGSTVT